MVASSVGAPDRPTPTRSGRGVASLLLAAALVAPATGLRGQTDPGAPGSLRLLAHHPLSGALLAPGDHYPVGGVPGDGEPDRVPFALTVSYDALPGDTVRTANDLALRLRDALASVQVAFRFGDGADLTVEPGWHLSEEVDPAYDEGIYEMYAARGELGLPSDLPLDELIDFVAVLYLEGLPVDSFTTEIRPGMPELRFRSTIVSENIGDMEGLRITGTTSGRAGLVFSDDYRTLWGRGELGYDEFRIEFLVNNPMQSCTIDTSTRDGYFQVVEANLFRDSLPPPVPEPDPGVDPTPDDVVFRLESGINESARISCPGSPVTFPIPQVLHFFAGFMSMHGGQVDGQPNEMDEGRGGLVMAGWQAGEGDVIATRTYSRRGSTGPGTLIEETVLELRWVN